MCGTDVLNSVPNWTSLREGKIDRLHFRGGLHEWSSRLPSIARLFFNSKVTWCPSSLTPSHTEGCAREIHFIHPISANTAIRFRAYRDVLLEFIWWSGIRQVCSILPLLFNLFIEMVMKIVLSSSGNCGIDTYIDRNLSGIEYTDDVRLLSQDPVLW